MTDNTPKMPEQLRKQIAEAEQIRAQIEGSASPGPEGDGAGQAPSSDAAPPQQEAPDGGAPPAGEEQPESWEQRFRSQQGRLEQSQRTNQELSNRLNQLESTIEALRARGNEQPAAPPPPAPTKLVTDQEVTDFGEELLTVVGKRAREEFMPELEQLASRLNRMESAVQNVGSVVDKTQKRDVYQVLNEQIPDWRMVNHAPEFKDWLSRPDPYSGQIRQKLLTESFDRNDSSRVLAFFTGFLTEAVGTPPNASSDGSSAPPLAQPGNGSGRPSLEDFAAPGRARSAPHQLPPDKPSYTSAQIEQFMDDRRRGRWRGREAEAEAIERDIFQAQHEGRIH